MLWRQTSCLFFINFSHATSFPRIGDQIVYIWVVTPESQSICTTPWSATFVNFSFIFSYLHGLVIYSFSLESCVCWGKRPTISTFYICSIISHLKIFIVQLKVSFGWFDQFLLTKTSLETFRYLWLLSTHLLLFCRSLASWLTFLSTPLLLFCRSLASWLTFLSTPLLLFCRSLASWLTFLLGHSIARCAFRGVCYSEFLF